MVIDYIMENEKEKEIQYAVWLFWQWESGVCNYKSQDTGTLGELLGSPEYGALISNNAGGYSFAKSGANGRILRYVFNNFDQPGRYIYIRDNDSKITGLHPGNR